MLDNIIFSISAFMITITMVNIELLIFGLRSPTPKGWGIILYIAIMPSFLSQIFLMRGVDLVGPSSAGLYANLVPIFSAFMAVIILNESFSIYHLFAMSIVFAGNAIFELQKRMHVKFLLFKRIIKSKLNIGVKMAHLDRMRAEKLMREIGIEALILLSPESFFYATGVKAGVATMWRRSGAVAVLVPCDPKLPETAIVSDLFARNFREVSHITDVRESPIWVETVNLEGEDKTHSIASQVASAWRKSARVDDFNRPTTFDPVICYQHLIDAISQQGFTHNDIGFEASAISVSDYQVMSDIFSEIKLIDASRMIDKLKMVKTDQEIAYLSQAVEIAESGIIAVRDAIDIHITRDELAEVWRQAIANHSMSSRLSGSWEYISVGNNPWGGNAAITDGDLIKVDVGCLVQGYTSDSARTFVFSKPDDTKVEIYNALMSGFMAGIELLQPGVQLNEIYHSTLGAIRKCGFPNYIRGHFGHGLGAGLGSEQWPFIAVDEETKLQPGMVMAFECPWYIDGVGGLIIENQFLITDSGHQMMNNLPLGLEEINKIPIRR